MIDAHLPTLAPQYDFVIVNGENSAGGVGLHRDAAKNILAAGAHCITLGNHAWHHKDIYGLMQEEDKFPIVRPLNYSDPGTPGVGWRTFDVGGERLTVVNLLGRVFMEAVANPFLAMDELLGRETLGSVFVDFHAEATSEKVALARYLDGRVAAVIGTHTHVPTADSRILAGGTAFQADCGFTGPIDSVIGADPEAPIQKFLSERPHRFTVAGGRAELNAVVLDISGNRAHSIERYHYEEPA